MKRLKWAENPKYFRTCCVWSTVAKSRYRVVERLDDEGMELSDCEAQFRDPRKGDKWVVLSYHSNPILAMRACGRHRGRWEGEVLATT